MGDRGGTGPGNNLFIFIEDPDGSWIEVSAELEVIHDRPVKDWPTGGAYAQHVGAARFCAREERWNMKLVSYVRIGNAGFLAR